MSPEINDIKEIIFGVESREPDNLSTVLKEVTDWLDNHDIIIKDIIVREDSEFGNWFVIIYIDKWWLDKAVE